MQALYRYAGPFGHDLRENVMIGKISAGLTFHVSRDLDVMIKLIPKGDIWTHLEMRVNIEHENGRMLKMGNVVKFSSLKPAVATAKGSEIPRGNRPTSWLFRLQVEVFQPKIRNTADLHPAKMWITAGDSKEKCLYIPEEIFSTLPIHFKTLLLEDRHPHFKNLKEEDLGNLDLIDYIIAQHFYQCASFSHHQSLSCLRTHLQNANCPEIYPKSPLFALNRNFQKMQLVHSLEDYKEIMENQNSRGNPCFDRPQFRKPDDVKNWLQVIEGNLTLEPQDDWVLRLFVTNGGKHLGYSLVSLSKRELCKYNMTLEFKGFIPKDCGKKGATTCTTLKFDISPHGSQAQYSYGSPVLETMEEVKKIGMGHQNATVTLKFKNKGLQNIDESIVKFNGINNYIIKTDDVEIHINREVLLQNSVYFVAMCNNTFEEDNTDECELKGDDKDALVLCFKILYGCGAPLNYKLLGNLLLVANKYAFVEIVKYLDAIMISLARKNRLPQLWMNHIEKIVDRCSLSGLKAYIDGLRPEQRSSVVDREEGHIELLIGLGILFKETDEQLPMNNNSTETPRIVSIPALQQPFDIEKRPLETKTEVNHDPKKRRLFYHFH